MQKYAIMSVYKKENIENFAENLVNLGYKIISTGGTAKKLQEHGLEVIKVSEITGFPEVMNGRVKSLHPKIHGGILCDRNNKSHVEELEKNDIELIDIVVVNLYPFEETMNKENVTYADVIENIDIGGPTLIRAAAKNHKHTTVVTDNDDFDDVVFEVEEYGRTTEETRKELAKKAFQLTADYDSLIANYFSKDQGINEKEKLQISSPLFQSLRYGENPHQKAGFFQKNAAEIFSHLHGKQLSYNNYLDLESALNLIRDFDEPTVAIFKHTNPSGVATDINLTEAYKKAFATDELSPFGGIVILNRKLELETALEINKVFTEIILAPEFSDDALKKLKKKKNRRLLKFDMDKLKDAFNKTYVRSCMDGFLAQDRDQISAEKDEIENWKVVTETKPDKALIEELKFGWKVVAALKSNAVCFTKEQRTLGLGLGQPSRIDSTEIAVSKAKKFGLSLVGSVCASDAFFPFRDSIDTIAELGVKAVIQPGGSRGDEEVIKACNEHGIAMIFTGKRHFRH